MFHLKSDVKVAITSHVSPVSSLPSSLSTTACGREGAIYIFRTRITIFFKVPILFDLKYEKVKVWMVSISNVFLQLFTL